MIEKKKKEPAPKVVAEVSEYKTANLKMLKEKCLFLYETGRPFVLVKTGGSYVLQSDLFNAKAVRRGFTPAGLSFIKRVKKHIADNFVADKFIETDYQVKKINYIQVRQFAPGEAISDLVEIDINQAYWETAYVLGVIDEKIYNYGMSEDVNKMVRLASLGSLAKKTEQWSFDGKKMKKLKDIRSHSTENVWFAICKRVADVMGEAVRACGDDFVFYWVDGIYVRNNPITIAKVIQVFQKWGYGSKSKAIHDITFTDDKFIVRGVKKGDEREFSYPSKHRADSVKRYNEDKRLQKLAEEIFLK